MKTPNTSQIQAEVFSLLMQQLEPWKVAHFWAMCQLGSGDYLSVKQAQPDTETLAELIAEIRNLQDRIE